MKEHVVSRIIKKQGDNSQLVFYDGSRVFWPNDCLRGLTVGTIVHEHQHKNGQTVAFSWNGNIRFVVSQPFYYDESFEFIERFRFFDRIPFNRAVVQCMNYRIGPVIFPDISKIAHNLVLLGIKQRYGRLR